MYKSDSFMQRFAHVGAGAQVFEFALVLKPESIWIGEGVRIDDYCRIEGGEGLRIGRCVHVSSFSSIFGGGRAEIGDYCGIAQGARLITGSEQQHAVMSAAAPAELRDPMRGRIVLGAHAFVGTNAVVLPNVTIGEGAVVGAGALVMKDVPPWTVVVGNPARFAGKRDPLTTVMPGRGSGGADKA
jgi:acetyltransferase-like isoleucine patch superfamily enzyme